MCNLRAKEKGLMFSQVNGAAGGKHKREIPNLGSRSEQKVGAPQLKRKNSASLP